MSVRVHLYHFPVPETEDHEFSDLPGAQRRRAATFTVDKGANTQKKWAMWLPANWIPVESID